MQKLLLVLMLCASDDPTAEIDYKRHCRPALEKWAGAYSRFAADHNESEAAAKVVKRLTENLGAVLAIALNAEAGGVLASGQN